MVIFNKILIPVKSRAFQFMVIPRINILTHEFGVLGSAGLSDLKSHGAAHDQRSFSVATSSVRSCDQILRPVFQNRFTQQGNLSRCMNPAHVKGILDTPCLHLDVVKRRYAKGKSKGKEKAGKGKGSGKLMKLSQEEMDSVLDLQKFHQQLNGQLEHLKNEFIQQLGLRTSLGTFDNLMIDTADGKFPLIQLGQVAQKNQQTIVINMTTNPQYIPSVKTALMNSMSLNAQQDGTTVFINIPKVTKEHRESLAKTAKGMADKTKAKLRDIQSKNLQNIKKNKEHHSEDVLFSVQQFVQDEVKKSIDKIDTLTAAKQKELLG